MVTKGAVVTIRAQHMTSTIENKASALEVKHDKKRYENMGFHF